MSEREESSQGGFLRSRRTKVHQSLHKTASDLGIEIEDEGHLAIILSMKTPPRAARSSPPTSTGQERKARSPSGSPRAGSSKLPVPPFPGRRSPPAGEVTTPSTTRGKKPFTGPTGANKFDRSDENNNVTVKRSSSPPPQEAEGHQQEEVSCFLKTSSHSLKLACIVLWNTVLIKTISLMRLILGSERGLLYQGQHQEPPHHRV